MNFKKIFLLALTCVLLLQTVVFAYDVLEDEELLGKHKIFVNKYSYDIELQDKVLIELYPDRSSGISYKEENGVATNISTAVYVDGHADAFSTNKPMLIDSKLSINGEEPISCYLYRDRTLVAATVFEQVGCEVVFDEETCVLQISKDGIYIETMPYMLDMRKNGEDGFWIPMGICSRYIGESNEIYVPMRFIAEELGLSVDWDNERHMAMLNN